MVEKKLMDLFKVAPRLKVDLTTYDPDWVGDEEMQRQGERITRQRSLELLEKEKGVLADAQGKLYASDMYAVLIILLGAAGAGMDDVVKHVMTGVNPQGCQVKKFVKPSSEELDHDFLWRYSRALPERGRIGIFHGSYYDEVVSTRVNPDLLKREKLPQLSRNESSALSGDEAAGSSIHAALWKARYKSINEFEGHLVRNGIVTIKIHLNISRAVQKQRLLEIIDDPARQWNFTPIDLAQQKSWEIYQEAYQESISATSTSGAPWYIIPANHIWAASALVADIVTDVILGLGVDYPKLSPEKRKELEEARKKLESEGEK